MILKPAKCESGALNPRETNNVIGNQFCGGTLVRNPQYTNPTRTWPVYFCDSDRPVRSILVMGQWRALLLILKHDPVFYVIHR